MDMRWSPPANIGARQIRSRLDRAKVIGTVIIGEQPAKPIKIWIEWLRTVRVACVRIAAVRIRVPDFDQTTPYRALVLIKHLSGNHYRLTCSLRPAGCDSR